MRSRNVTPSFRFCTRTSILVALLTAGLLFAAGVLAQSGGQLDPTFGTGGRVTTDFFGNNDSVNAIAIQADGKIVVAGSARRGGVFTGVDEFALARYNPDGTLDSTFGTGGRVTTDFFGSGDDARAIAIQADGRIVAAGGVATGSIRDFALARYNIDGTLDATFGTGGKVTTDFSDFIDEVRDVVIQADGKILAVGETLARSSSTSFDFALARYNTDGTLDLTFGTKGRVTTDFMGGSELFGNQDQARAVVLQADGRIVVAGSAANRDTQVDFALARYIATPLSEQQPLTAVLSRNTAGDIVATITLTNTTQGTAANAVLTLVRASTLDESTFVDGVPVPQSLGTVGTGQSVTRTVTFPGTSGVPSGTVGLIRVEGTFDGGSFSLTRQITTP